MVGFGFVFFADSGDFCSCINCAAQRACRRTDCRAFDNFRQSVGCFCNDSFRRAIYRFFFEEELFEEDDLAVDFAAGLADLLDDDFELAPEDLLDAAFEPEPDDLLADDFDLLPVDLLAVDLLAVDLLADDLLAVDFPAEDDLLAGDFDVVFEPADLLADDDFAAVLAAGLAEADLLPLAEDDLLAVVLLLVVADFPEFFFVVAIVISLKFF